MLILPDKKKLLLNFSSCNNWEERYLYIIKLGKSLPKISNSQKNNCNFILGCQSNVWIDIKKQQDKTIILTGDSDAMIVKGLLSIVIILFQGKTASQILKQDFESYFKQLDLKRHLTTSRTQGLNSIIRNIFTRVNKLI
ncbi:cysteine desulfuration protein SufE [Candidatus Providencia siddallii]|uniref:Cysteine desulfuration protein SufE n=1 Tax=Candidatus Providencia siddallii TaxID=1715285 RepID=A0ABM9NPM9_9GAMM